MLRTILFLVLSLALAIGIYFRFDRGEGYDGIPSLGKRPTYAPYYPAWILPLFVVILPVILSPFYGFIEAMETTVSTCAGLFLHISVYYLVLMALRPLLRGRISARTCAMLWIIPNLLYLTVQEVYRLPHPRWVLALPVRWPHLLFGVWLVGFLGVLGWYVVQHLRFRRRILTPAYSVTHPQALKIWEEALKEAGLRNPNYQLVISPAVTTPLSVGLLPRSTRVVLPQRSYTPEQLHWVLHHEVIHLARQDSATKFFLLFCTAICWFNPLMWVAMKGCAQDLELSCDETVLLFAKPEQRKEYAALLLDTAGDARGFTTCLSASASTLRHRLKQVLSPAVRSSGAIVAGLAFFLVSMTSGWVALAWGTTSGQSLFYDTYSAQEYTVEVFRTHDRPLSPNRSPVEQEAFHRYLARLTLTSIQGNYTFSDRDDTFSFQMQSPGSDHLVHLYPHMVVLTTGGSSYYYYVAQGVDLDYLAQLVTGDASQ